jgi:hypothetical protein
MSDPVSELKRELLAAAERQQSQAVPDRKSRRRWLLRSDVQQVHRRRRLFALVAAALVVAVGTASAIGGVRDFFLDTGFIGLPPEGAAPSAPESGELVAHWDAWHPQVRAWVYADGRMIWSRSGSVPEGANELTSGYLEQRLTPDGVALVRSAVGGLFDRARALGETVPADARPEWPGGGLVLSVPPDYGVDFGSAFGSVEVPDGDRLVRLNWSVPPVSALDEDVERTATPEQVSALRQVAALLTDPASVLPSNAWAVREVRAYVPSHYAVCIDTSPPKDVSDLLSLLPARAAYVLRGKSRTQFHEEVVGSRGSGPIVVLGQRVRYCSTLRTEEARDVADALSGLEPDPRAMRHRLGYRVEGVNDWRMTAIWFEPYFPHGQFTDSQPAG